MKYNELERTFRTDVPPRDENVTLNEHAQHHTVGCESILV